MKPFSFMDRIKSFKYAFRGLKTAFTSDHNLWIHLVATALVIAGGYLAGTSMSEKVFLTITIALVWITELLNTALEKLCDFVTRERNKQIRMIKDISAAAVLIAALAALITGGLIFIPKFF